MDRDPSTQTLPGLMISGPVVVEYMSSEAHPKDAQALEQVKQGEVLIGEPHGRTELFHLDSISPLGIEVKKDLEGGNEVFIPWSAVLALYGPSREALERFARAGG